MPPKVHVEGPTPCPRCGDKVYKAEEVVCEGMKWHKKCFGCKDCGKKLDSTTCNTHEGRSEGRAQRFHMRHTSPFVEGREM